MFELVSSSKATPNCDDGDNDNELSMASEITDPNLLSCFTSGSLCDGSGTILEILSSNPIRLIVLSLIDSPGLPHIGGKRFLPNNCFSYSNACNLAFSSANLAFVFAICKF
jgi:hypothetical protein